MSCNVSNNMDASLTNIQIYIKKISVHKDKQTQLSRYIKTKRMILKS